MMRDTDLAQDLLKLGDSVIHAYAVWILILFIIRIVNGKQAWLVNLLEIANSIVLIIALFRLVNLCWQLAVVYQSGYLYEQFAFYNRTLGKYFWAYALLFLVQFLPLLFVIKNVRCSFVLPLLLMPFVEIERYIIILTSFSDDYLPSSWSYIFKPFFIAQIWNLIAFTILVSIGFVVKRGWNKLAQ